MNIRLAQISCLFLVIVLLIGIESCTVKEPTKIDNDIIINYLDLEAKSIFVSTLDSVQLNLRTDTLKSNIPFNYKEVLAIIDERFIEIDTIETNTETRQFLKAMLLADFVFSSFSLQLFGNRYGLANDVTVKNDWNSYSTSEQYGLGNNNIVSLDCGGRTNFYLQLIDNLLNLSGRDTSIPGIHTYPIIEIGAEEYILDPSEPVVFTDSKSNILSFDDLKLGVEEIHFLRTKRSFGGNHFLISKDLNQSLLQFDGDMIRQIKGFIRQEIIEPEKKIPDCNLPIFEKEWNVYPLNQTNNKFAIEVNYQRNLLTSLNYVTFYNSYFGKPCN